MAVLYRKYRPQTFAEVLGQKHIVQTLMNQAAGGQVAHAYLFTGGRGLGKTSVARILAKAVNCLNRTQQGDACGVCGNCKAIAAGNFMDLVEIDAASNTGVDNIRDLIEHVKFSPALGKFKVFIIDEVHMLSKGAFNALLKTLEEPPAHAIFILATTEIAKVPATIISRTQRFDFKRFSGQDLEAQLKKVAGREKAKVSEEVLRLIAERAEGGARDALSLLDKVLTLGDNPDMADVQRLLGFTDASFLERLLSIISLAQTAEIPPFLNSLLEQGADAAQFNRDFLEYLRKVLVYKTAPKSIVLSEGERLDKIRVFASAISAGQLMFIMRLFLKSLKDLPFSPSPEIPLLLASLEACGKFEAAAKTTFAGSYEPARPPLVKSQQTAEEPAQPEIKSELEIELLDESVPVSEVEGVWRDLVSKLREVNGPLANLVKTSPIAAVRDGRVVLSVRYQFHKQNLESAKNTKLICDLLFSLLHKRLGIMADVVKPEAEKPAAGEALGDALKIFGGELIE